MPRKKKTPITFEHTFSLDDLTRDGLKRMLISAWRHSANETRPLHRRERLVEEANEEDGLVEEYEKLADLHEEQVGASSPPALSHLDFPKTNDSVETQLQSES